LGPIFCALGAICFALGAIFCRQNLAKSPKHGPKFGQIFQHLKNYSVDVRHLIFFLRGSVISFLIGFCYRQVAILLWLLGINIIISLKPIP
jgi:hypothetical protein